MLMRYLMMLPLFCVLIMPVSVMAQTRLQVGVVAAVSGKITVSYEEIGREATTGEKIFIGDVIETTASSKMQILLKDLTAITVAPSSRLVIDEFVYDPGVEQKLSSTLLKGVVKMSSPRLKGVKKSDRKLMLPNAVVAIRGTEFLARVGEGDDQVILFNGLINVENPQFVRELAKPNFGVSISDDGQISVPQFIDDEALGDVLSALEPASEEQEQEAEEGGADQEQTEEESSEESSEGETSEGEASEEQSDEQSENDSTSDEDASGESSEDETSESEQAESEPAESEPAENEPSESTTENTGSTTATTETSAANAPSSAPASAPASAPDAAPTTEVSTEVEAAPLDVGLDGLSSLASVEPTVETPTIEVAAISIDNQITQELNEVLETVSNAVSEEEETSDPATTDSDGDGVVDSNDAFPNDASESVDTDNDGIGNNADNDDDDDGVADTNDPNPLVNDTLDTDGDGTLDIVDTDDDGDGVPDSSDAFPLDSNESADSDGDGTGDNADTLDNSRLYTDTSTYDHDNFNSSTWNDIASQLGTGTAVFSITNQSATVSSGSGCSGCSAVVDTSISIDFSAMNYQFNSEVDFTKPGYEVVTMTDQSGTIPLGQKELTTGSLYTGSSSSTINDLESTRQYDQEYTFTSTSDSSVTISKELDVGYYYHADLSDPSDMDSTQFGVNGYTKILYGNNSSEFTQLNTSRAALEPQ